MGLLNGFLTVGLVIGLVPTREVRGITRAPRTHLAALATARW